MTLLKELERLKVSSGNAKLTSRNIFSLPAGLTCPKSKLCKSWAKVINGKSQIIDCLDAMPQVKRINIQWLEIIAWITLKRF